MSSVKHLVQKGRKVSACGIACPDDAACSAIIVDCENCVSTREFKCVEDENDDSDDELGVLVHYLFKDRIIHKDILDQFPRLGDECILNTGTIYNVDRVVWVPNDNWGYAGKVKLHLSRYAHSVDENGCK